MTRPIARAAGTLALLITTLLGGPAANASVGVGVGAAILSPRGAVQPGSTVVLPPWWVQNTGTQLTEYELRAAPHAAAREKPIPTSWVSLTRVARLAPGQHALVPVRVHIPVHTAGGVFGAYLFAAGAAAPARPGTGAAVGAAAVTEVRLIVASRSSTAGPGLAEVGLLAGIAVALITLVAAGWRRRANAAVRLTETG